MKKEPLTVFIGKGEETSRVERNLGKDRKNIESSSHLRVSDITKSSEVWITGAKCQQLHLHRAAFGLVFRELQLYCTFCHTDGK